jgi:hypothetical protein
LSRTQKIAIAALAVFCVLVAWLALRNRQPPFVPNDEDHVGVPVAGCETCHGPDGVYFRGRNHPLGNDCTRCHGPEP